MVERIIRVNKRWILPKIPDEDVAALSGTLNIPPFLARCLWQRGQRTSEESGRFLSPRLRELGDPFALPDMDRAVNRLFEALAEGHPVVIFGDYDVDGVTATALLFEFLRDHGWRAATYLPHRLDEGYGLSVEGVDNCLERHPCRLLLAVDCGSSSADVIVQLQARSIDAIVLDHHQPGTPPPSPVAFVNPQRLESSSPLRDLCSAGLAFKLIHALVKEGRRREDARFVKTDVRLTLDLVALGTVADLVPLTRENRILVSNGLERLRATPREGVRSLIQVSGVRSSLGVSEVAFQLAPRLNAAGRIEQAGAALDLLLTRDKANAFELATGLDLCNQERQRIEKLIATEAVERARREMVDGQTWFIVVGDASWHLGVVGIVASRVLREFHRPAIVLGSDGENWRGSGRSIEGLDLSLALRECSDLLIRSGGHAMAAGLTIHPSQVDALRIRLNHIAQSRVTPEQWTPSLLLDAMVTSREITLENLDWITRMEPFGQGNHAVRLCLQGARLSRTPMRVGRDNRHLKFQVTDGLGSPLDAIWWNAPPALPNLDRFDIAFTPSVNEYMGRRLPQLSVLDLRPSADAS